MMLPGRNYKFQERAPGSVVYPCSYVEATLFPLPSEVKTRPPRTAILAGVFSGVASGMRPQLIVFRRQLRNCAWQKNLETVRSDNIKLNSETTKGGGGKRITSWPCYFPGLTFNCTEESFFPIPFPQLGNVNKCFSLFLSSQTNAYKSFPYACHH